jgi:hypothetical protein
MGMRVTIEKLGNETCILGRRVMGFLLEVDWVVHGNKYIIRKLYYGDIGGLLLYRGVSG